MLKGCVEQAKHFGIDLASYAPETLSLKDIKDFDQLMEASQETLEVLINRINDGHERAIRLLDEAKKSVGSIRYPRFWRYENCAARRTTRRWTRRVGKAKHGVTFTRCAS